jgi:hypothetical protein
MKTMMKNLIQRTGSFCLSALLLLIVPYAYPQVTTGSLLVEMTDLQGLSRFPYPAYETTQFSSYDRNSVSRDQPGWFANSDGFGREPIPGFEEVLEEPGENGIGRYLICDVAGPGAVVRLWTARITGNLEVYLDGSGSALYSGPAQEFFFNTYDAMAGTRGEYNQEAIFWQNTAGYYPIPFEKGIKMIWEGNLNELHFYHVQVRKYKTGISVNSFSKADLQKFRKQIADVRRILADPDGSLPPKGERTVMSGLVEDGSSRQLGIIKGGKAISHLTVKVQAGDMDRALRQSILKIRFDGASSAQVQCPLGDFFGAAPGINPYHSLPFSVYPDGTMTCRFHMPFRDSVSVEIENLGTSPVHIYSELHTVPHSWSEGSSMYFRARWRIDHGLHASYDPVQDIPYLIAQGKGVCVGAAAYIYNPTSVPSSWGNWWGEGDEKIFIDQAAFPDFFGTGSEDYFNYSWSSSAIFTHPYCGQPRNDGPANRGFVSNYRWHILDRIPFRTGLAFYMELFSHEPVENFSYGRMVYTYAVPGFYDDHLPLTREDVKHLELPKNWYPVGVKGAHGATFFQAEVLVDDPGDYVLEEADIWSGGSIMAWAPGKGTDQLELNLPVPRDGKYNIVFTVGKDREGGSFRVKAGDNFLELGEDNLAYLHEPHRVLSRNYRPASVELSSGINKLTVIPAEGNTGKIKIDFIWLMKSNR